jgi:hypothetical protein
VTPSLYLAAALGALLLLAGVGYKAYRLGQDSIIAAQAKEQAAVRATVEAMIAAGAKEIAKIDVTNKTIIQKVQREVIEKPVYTNCRSGADSLQQFNTIVTGSSDATRDGELPRTDPAK